MKFISTSILSALLFLSISCAHEPAIQELPATAIPADEVAKLEQDLNEAVVDQIDVLAPTSYSKAQEYLKDAKEDVKDQDDAKDILRKVATGKAYLAKAQEFAKVSESNLSEVVVARKLALTEGAKDAFGSEFRAADKDLTSVTSDIEENKTDKAAKERTAILAKYLDLEVRAIRRSALNVVQGKINQAKKDDAEDWAPQSLKAAEKSLKDADNFIIANRHDKARIKELSDQAMAAADKLILINKEARSGTKATGEIAALKLFAEREKLADERAKVSQQQTELATAQTQLNQAEAKNMAVTGALADDKVFNQKFEQARTMFDKNEAEVYRQGDNLVIRLKGLDFNSAKATLKGSNFPLLAKAKNVIGGFNADIVAIEGHTDSVGSKSKNAVLSEARAEAVKSYFESNATPGESTRYTATGFGFQKPIASNKTADGRAQNRRVDIVIHTR